MATLLDLWGETILTKSLYGGLVAANRSQWTDLGRRHATFSVLLAGVAAKCSLVDAIPVISPLLIPAL